MVICGHVSPDGDCVGSALALAWALRSLGKRVTCLLAKDEPIEYGLRFMPGVPEMVPAGAFQGRYRTFISVDVPNADRMGPDAKRLHAAAEETITIDHHISNGPMSRVNYADADAPAAAMIVWQLLPLLGVEPDERMATCCYVGLLTDTGRFQYQNTTAEALQMAGEMVAAGVDPAQVAREVYQNRSRPSIALEKRMLSRIEYLCGGKFVLSYLKRSDFVETGAIKADAEPMIDVIRSIRDVRVACMLREQEGQVRGSLRAKDETDVSLIANRFGGGGHKAAAGFTFEGSLEDARRVVAKALRELDVEA
ncbi:MAG: DHH family phosphoesterase [Eggerthellaceae bacterium]|nr:DHH family phosphoesterase [Eggerthellaceae bacterium]